MSSSRKDLENKALRPEGLEDKAVHEGEVLEPADAPSGPAGVTVLVAHYNRLLPDAKPGDELVVDAATANSLIAGGVARLVG